MENQNKSQKNYAIIIIAIIAIMSIFTVFAPDKQTSKNQDNGKKNAMAMQENGTGEITNQRPQLDFYGKEFRDSQTLKQIDMTTDVVTIFNSDGTYTSKADWSTSEQNEDTYNNTVGRSSDNVGNFTGRWIAVNEIANEDVGKLANHDVVDATDYLIRYTSNTGKTRYAKIYLYENRLWLSVIPYQEDIVDKSYSPEALDMFEGYCYP